MGADVRAATPFPMKHGINVAGAFVRAQAFRSPGPDGQVSGFAGLARDPPAYSAAELRSMGFDFVRLPVNPAPLLENPPAVRARLLTEVERGIAPYRAQGVGVILDLHFWRPANKVWTDTAVISAADPAVFARYRALVVEIAARLARYPDRQVALELLNEPPHQICAADRWFRLQSELVRAVRGVAPRLPIVVTGCNDGVDDLTAMTPANTDLGDPNLIYTFHFYDPFLFTHQAYPGRPYIDGVPYPARAGRMEDTLARTNARIEAENLPDLDAARARLSAARDIARYFVQAPDRAYIDKRLDRVTAWARANHIAPSRLLLGEFAAIDWRTTDSPARLKARLAWDDDVKAAADARGVAWAYWNLPAAKGAIFR